MCGIIGFIGNDDAYGYILSGLELLQNRGYDSAGISVLEDNKFITSKYASIDALQRLEDKKQNGKIGIGHTRWATHGGKTDVNAHPHLDSNGMVAIVHNGIIENYMEIKQKLNDYGYTFVSQTDSEVIANLISYYYSIENNAEKALFKTFNDLQGTWAVVIMFRDHPNHLFVCKNGSPLVIGYDKTWGCIISSEQLPLSKYFSNYVSMNDGDIISVYKQMDGIISFPSLSNYSLLKIQNKIIESSPHPYAHWTLKEIYEQEHTILRALNNGGRIINPSSVKLGGLDENIESLKEIKTIIILGCGTSLYAGSVASVIFKRMKCFDSVFCYDASEFTPDDIPRDTNIGFVVLSQSGETKDVHRCLKLTKNFPVISIINVVGSMIALESTCGIYLNAGREVGVASTKSFTSQIVVMTLLAIWFCQIQNNSEFLRKQYITSLRNLSYQVRHVLTTCRDHCRLIAERVCDTKKTIFILGRRESHFLAREAALKLKEIAYIEAEGCSAGSLKHGPFALIDENSLIFLLAPRDEYFDKMMNTAEEIYSRKANIIMITTDRKPPKCELFADIIVLPHNETLNSILCIVPMQIIAYESAMIKGLNPDFPRNLAKVVTVDG
jgi:glutamine---fructose-6-phosphate transaminase (isomerizing)